MYVLIHMCIQVRVGKQSDRLVWRSSDQISLSHFWGLMSLGE